MGTHNPCYRLSRYTQNLLKVRYWWPNMLTDSHQFIFSWIACAACAQAKVPRTLPAGKLVPLYTPQHPSCHLTTELITDLPDSQGNTIIMVSVEHYSGIPEDIISEWGTQYTSRFWANFMEKLGACVSSGNIWLSCLVTMHWLTDKVNGQTRKLSIS